MIKRRIQILDTTLRDGNKLPFVVLNIHHRLDIARQLLQLGVDVLDAGYPAASREDRESVSLIAREVKGLRISALSRALAGDVEKALEALRENDRPYLHIFLPVSPAFLNNVLKTSREQTLKAVEHTILLGKDEGVDVQFSLGEIGQADQDFLPDLVRTACAAGAEIINLADSNGTLYPADARALIAQVLGMVLDYPNTVVGVHFHNDLGLATANTLTALEAGAGHVEVTLGGIGARGGNTALEEVVFGLEAFSDRLGLSHGIRLNHLYNTASLISRMTGIQPHPNKPILGKCAFLEPRGSHTRDSLGEDLKRLLKDRTIGRLEDALIGDREMSLAGFKQQLENMEIASAGINLDKVYHLYQSQLRRKKAVHLSEIRAMVDDARLEEKSPYKLISFNVMTGSHSLPVGIIELQKEGTSLVQSSYGSGPVDALCQAVDKAVGLKPRLVLYSVDSLTEGKDARAEVTVALTYMGKRFHGHYDSTDVIEASLRAYLDAINRIEIHRTAGTEEEFYINGEYLWE